MTPRRFNDAASLAAGRRHVRSLRPGKAQQLAQGCVPARQRNQATGLVSKGWLESPCSGSAPLIWPAGAGNADAM